MKSYPAKSEIIWENIAINDHYLITRIQWKAGGFSQSWWWFNRVAFCLIPEGLGWSRWNTLWVHVFTFPKTEAEYCQVVKFFRIYYHHTYPQLPFVLLFCNGWCLGCRCFILYGSDIIHMLVNGESVNCLRSQMFAPKIDLPSRAKKMDKLRQESQIHI